MRIAPSPPSVALLLCPLLFATSGCSLLRTLQGRNTVDLKGAEIVRMSVDLRKQEKTICPRERVQMGVFLDAKLAGDDKPQSFETWAGPPGTSRNGKLDFSEFAFASELGVFDDDGFFTPAKDVRASAGKEFSVKAVYRTRPDKFSFELGFKPDYACIKTAPFGGAPGATGRAGQSGKPGESGRYGGSNAGGRGGNGGSGSPGGQGADGGDGPHLQAYATFVKTPYYPKLLAIRIRGERDDLLLASHDTPFVVEAIGGRGGDGGPGGSGGPGGGGGAGNPAGDGGDGGRGGDGGNGGRGGHGGEVEIVFDAAFPELGDLLKANVAGGEAGRPGGAGGPGSKGTGGAGTSTTPGVAPKSGNNGAEGAKGGSGGAGAPGPAGRFFTHPGDVAAQIAGPDITPLSIDKETDVPSTPPPATDPSKGKKPGKPKK